MKSRRLALDEYLGKAFESIPVAMIVVDAAGEIIRVSEVAEAIFGYAREELIGQKGVVLRPPRERRQDPDPPSITASASTGCPWGAGRYHNGLRKDGSEFPLEVGINLVETGEGPMTLLVVLDLSERKLSEKRIRDALEQKEILLKEVHHRVKNNLQVIHSLLDLQALRIVDNDLVNVLRDSQNRIRSMSLIHQTLYLSQNFAQVDFQLFLSELLPRLSESYGTRASQVRIDIRALDVTLPINEAIPCGLIINELVSNAFKHGFPNQQSGTVVVEISRSSDQMVELSVSDDGQGIPPDTHPPKSDSLGLQLVHLLTRQLHGTLDVQSRNPTRFTLRFRMGDKP